MGTDQERTLCYDDEIALYSEDCHGYVFSYQSRRTTIFSSAHNELGVGQDQDRLLPSIPNIHGAVFKICVQHRHKFNKELIEVQRQLSIDPKNAVLQAKITQMKSLAEVESEDNVMEQKRQTGKQLYYGSVLQLQHKYSQKFIHVNANKTSWTEPSNILVELGECSGKSTLFRIMPRYKVKAEGDPIQIGDQIVLESIKSMGQFLHSSRDPFGFRMVYSDSLELNLSVRPTSFTVSAYSKAVKPQPNKRRKPPSAVPSDSSRSAGGQKMKSEEPIRGGDYLRLYHRELEAYLVAEGLHEINQSENVHFRVRPMIQSVAKTMYPSTSAITFWQIEKEPCALDGERFLSEEQCRFRHATTRQYLSMNEQGAVSLLSNSGDPRSVFRIHPVVKGGDLMEFDSFVRIQHVLSGYWLHAQPDSDVIETDSLSKEDVSMKGLKWTTAVLRQVCGVEEMMYDDAFSLQKLNHNLVFTPRRIARIKTGFDELREFMVVRGVGRKPRQKLLRNYMVVDLLVELLKCPIKNTPNSPLLGPIFAQCYRLLYTYLKGDSRKNELYMARHLDFFMEQLIETGGIGLNAALMIMELVRDNRKMVDRITKKHIAHFCKLLKKNKNYRYLDLLNVLCICDGIAIPENQLYIAQKFIMKAVKKKRDNLFYTELGHKITGGGDMKANVLYVSVDSRKSWLPVHEFASKGQLQNVESYFYLEYQLKLYASLCYGRNEQNIELLSEKLELVNWKEAFLAMSDDRIPDQLRAVYANIIKHVFIDVGGNFSVLDRLNLVFIYPDVPFPNQSAPERADSILSDSVPLPFIKDLKRWIRGFLMEHRTMTASTIGRNKLITEALSLICSLVNFGYYGDTKDVKGLLDPMLELMDGRTDIPFPFKGGSSTSFSNAPELLEYRRSARFELTFETKTMMEAKLEAMKIVELFFNLRFNSRLERFVSEFKATMSSEQNFSESQKSSGELAELLYENPDHLKFRDKVKRKLTEIFEETNYIGPKFISILKDMCSYKHDRLVTQSLFLIDRYYSANENLFSRAVQAQVLITEKSCRALKTVREELAQFKLLTSTLKMNDKNVQKLSSILQTFTRLCVVEGEVCESHRVNQDILYNHGVLADVFHILSRKIDTAITEHFQRVQKVFHDCFKLLEAMARDNEVVQNRLFNRIECLMSIKGATEGLSNLFIQIFNGNKRICMSIQPNHINDTVEVLARTLHPTVLRLLSSLVMVGQLPLKRNQTMVVKYLLQNRDAVTMVIDTEPEDRLKMLMAPENDNSEDNTSSSSGSEALRTKRYLCNIVQLLSLCARLGIQTLNHPSFQVEGLNEDFATRCIHFSGENRSVESICQCMFTVEELLNIINLPLCAGLRKAFVQFLYSVFFNSTSDLASTDLKGFAHNHALWQYFEKAIGELESASGSLADNPTDGAYLMKQKPTWIHKDSADEVHERKELYHYLVDSVLPLLSSFLSNFYSDEEASDDTDDRMKQHLEQIGSGEEKLEGSLKLSQSEKSILGRLLTALESFSAAIHPCLSDPDSLNTLITLHKQLSTTTKSEKRVAAELLKGLPKASTNSPLALHRAYYSSENQLNSQLNTFSANVKTVYGGVNTVKDQIGLNYLEEYTCLDGIDDLPLSEEFQELVRVFMDEDEEKAAGGSKINSFIGFKRVFNQLNISRQYSGLCEKEKLVQENLDIKCLQIKKDGTMEDGIMEIKKIKKAKELLVSRAKFSISSLKHPFFEQEIIRALIHNEILRERMEKQKADDSVQKRLCHLGVIRTVLPHLNSVGNQIPKEVLCLLVKLLEGGNRSVQDSLAEYFYGTKEETFFLCIKDRMNLSAAAIKERRILGAKHKDFMAKQNRYLTANMSSKKRQSIDSKYSKRSLLADNGTGGFFAKRFNFGRKRPISPNQVKPIVPKIEVVELETIAEEKVDLKDKIPLITDQTLSVEGSNNISSTGVLILGNAQQKYADLTNHQNVDFLEFHDSGYIGLVVKLLGRMCDGQNRGLQDYLREQKDNIKSINLIGECGRFIQLLYGNIQSDNIQLLTQLFDCCIEFAVGNHSNQMVLFDQKVVHAINFLLRKREIPDCDLRQIYQLKMAIGKLLESMIEENTPSGHSKIIIESLNTEEILKTIIECHHQLTATTSNGGGGFGLDDLRSVEDAGFLYCHVLARSLDMIRNEDIELQAKESSAWSYFMSQTRSIEIVKDDWLQRIYFRVRDERVLRNWVKVKLKWEIDRSAPTNKLQDFLSWSKDIRRDIDYQKKINSFVGTRLLVRWWKMFNFLCLLLTFVINIGVLTFWVAPEKSDPNYNYSVATGNWRAKTDENFDRAMFWSGIVHCLLTFLIFVGYLLAQKPKCPEFSSLLFVRRRTLGNREYAISPTAISPMSISPTVDFADGEFADGRFRPRRKRETDGGMKPRMSHLEVKLFSFKTFYYGVLLVLSIMGVMISPAFFAFHLLHVAANNQLLTRVISAITLNGRSLLWVAFLGLIIMYVYALIGFSFLRDVFQDNNLFCNSLFECFLTIIREGLLYGLTERFDISESNPNFTFKFYAFKLLFDVSFFVIITTIGLNIIFGIIVDTFSELRDSKWQTEHDMRTTCFICSKTTSELENRGKGFLQHTQEEHNMWNYIYFFIYLDETPVNDLSALELYVFNLANKDRTDFFPLGRALSLIEWEDENADTRLETLLDQVNLLIRRMEKDDADKLREAHQIRQQQWWDEVNLARKSSFNPRHSSLPKNLEGILKRWPRAKDILGSSAGTSKDITEEDALFGSVSARPRGSVPQRRGGLSVETKKKPASGSASKG